MQALIFDLDGTLIDTVYAHVFAWQRTFAEAGMIINGWRIHRRIGMSGGLFTRAIGRELNHDFTPQEVDALQQRHGEIFSQILPERIPLPGAVDLITFLRARDIPFGIATSGARPEINKSLDALGIGDETIVIERGDVLRAKPEPDLFIACQKKLGVPANNCYVIG
ncbi:MAG: HAD family phosphatase, partial [Anaerolineae bacterium]|nr:HAD family phosphatase [Anaerolineae bacterium]